MVSSRRCHCSDQSKELVRLACRDVLSSPPELFTGTRWQEFLAHCGELFKVNSYRHGRRFSPADFELISAACDGVVMVVRAHHGQRETLQKTAGALDPKKMLGVVFNATEITEKDYYGYGYGSSKS